MLKELAVERFDFACAHCEHHWSTDYDVQHVEDGHGHAWDYYSLNGIPVTAPSATGSVCCPRCGAGWVHVELAAVRDIPLADPTGAEDAARPRQPADLDRRAARRRVPLLAGEQLPADQAAPAGGASHGVRCP